MVEGDADTLLPLLSPSSQSFSAFRQAHPPPRMTSPDRSDVSGTISASWTSNDRNGHSYSQSYSQSHPQNQYQSYANGHAQHGSPPSTAREYYSYDHASPTLAASSPHTGTLTSSINERFENKQDRFADGTQLGYAEMVSQDPQAVEPRWSDKIAYRNSTAAGSASLKQNLAAAPEERQRERKRRCGMTIPIFWLVVVAIVLAILAIALGVGIPLSKNSSSSSPKSTSSSAGGNETELSQTSIGGTINPTYFSRSGVFNGSGVALASANNGADADIFVFYQTWQGDIRQLLRSGDGSWHLVTTVTENARNATPLSVVAYVDNEVSSFHLFYIDRDNLVREKISTNASQSQENIWYDGPLNKLNLKSHDAELVGMQACYWGNYYGTRSNDNDSSVPTKSSPQTGINLFYASDDSTFVQYDWTNGQDVWNSTNFFPNMNTHAGVACQTWLTTTTSYIFMVDKTNTIQCRWRDTDVNKTSTAAHPINVWTLTNISIPDVHPSTSLGYTDYLAYQDSDSLFRGRNITWAAENTTFSKVPATASGSSGFNEWVVDDSVRGIPGSHMAITALDTPSGGRQLALFYQSMSSNDMGDGMTIGLRDSSYQGGWGQAYMQTNFTQ